MTIRLPAPGAAYITAVDKPQVHPDSTGVYIFVPDTRPDRFAVFDCSYEPAVMQDGLEMIRARLKIRHLTGCAVNIIYEMDTIVPILNGHTLYSFFYVEPGTYFLITSQFQADLAPVVAGPAEGYVGVSRASDLTGKKLDYSDPVVNVGNAFIEGLKGSKLEGVGNAFTTSLEPRDSEKSSYKAEFDIKDIAEPIELSDTDRLTPEHLAYLLALPCSIRFKIRKVHFRLDEDFIFKHSRAQIT